MTRIQLLTCHMNDDLSNNQVLLSAELMKHWDIPYYQTLTIVCGMNEVEVDCVPHTFEEEDLTLEASSYLFEDIGMPNHCRIRISYHAKEQVMLLGPVMAVLVQPSSNEENPFGNMTQFCEEMAQFAEKNHFLFYVFHVQQPNEKRLQTGFLYDAGEWASHALPIPDVVYNRIGSRKKERSEDTQALFQFFTNHHIPYFNTRFLSKWESHELLLPFEEIQPFLPDTRRFSIQELEEMLLTYPVVFVKPIHGSQGKGIYKISKEGEVFSVTYSSKNEKREFQTMLQLFVWLQKRIKKRPYLIQQGIQFVSIGGNAVDFRVLCIQNLENVWKSISTVGRVSTDQKFVANLSQGAEMMPVHLLLKQLFPGEEVSHIKKVMDELATECAHYLNDEAEGLFGEFGIDIGLDENHFPWIIEINTKPSKQFATEQEEATIRPSAKSIVRFAYSLASFPKLRATEVNEMKGEGKE